MSTRILVAGMGNDLCQDDGFGIVAVRRYIESGVPDSVRVTETGVGGINLVHQLMDGCDVLVIVDAVERGAEPGTLYLLEAEVPALEQMEPDARQEFLADMHYTVPSRALILARALGVLPRRVYILGCQPAECGLGMELSPPVLAAVEEAVGWLRGLVERVGREDAAA